MTNAVFWPRSHGSHTVKLYKWSDWGAVCFEEGWAEADWGLLTAFAYFLSSSGNYLSSVLLSSPKSQSRNLKYKVIDAWRLKPTASSQATHQNTMKRSESLKGEEVGVGGGCLCNILLFPGTFILMSLLQLQTPQKKVCFIHFFNMMSWKEKKIGFLRNFPSKALTCSSPKWFCLNKASEFLIGIYYESNSYYVLKRLYISTMGDN